MELTERQQKILAIVKENNPIKGQNIAKLLNLGLPTIRADLSLLVKLAFLTSKPKVGYCFVHSNSNHTYSFSLLKQLLVKEVQKPPILVYENTTISEAVITLFNANTGALIVADEQGHLIGIISRKDILKVTLHNQDAPHLPVSLVMTRTPNIITVTPEDSVLDSAKKMVDHQIYSLPVVKKIDSNPQANPLVVGRISKSTITRLFINFNEENITSTQE